jgi:hypothetical protein
VALNLFGVTVNDAHTGDIQVPDARLVTLRELAAICSDTEYRAVDPDDHTVQRASDVVAAYASRSPVLPAPVGVVFRSEESIKRWLELHYSALSEALSFVENRVAARVHVSHSEAEGHEGTDDIGALAAESIRVLRRAAVATLPLRAEAANGEIASAAFLIEDELWKNFVEEVEAQGKLTTMLKFEVTGPWPPYDFVQMQLGS